MIHLITALMLVDGQISTATAPYTPMHRSQPGSRQLAAKPIDMRAYPIECCVILDYSYQSKANQSVAFGSPPIYFAARRLPQQDVHACMITMQLISVCNCSSTSNISVSYYSLAVLSVYSNPAAQQHKPDPKRRSCLIVLLACTCVTMVP